MGRHLKEGLSYFPLDVDFFEDEKIQFVSARFGVKGDGIITRLLCKIYRQGYAIQFDDDTALLFARSVGDISLHGLVKDIVNELLKRGFFDEGIFKRFNLLTSKGIQKRYAKICTDAKRKDWQIRENVDLLNPKPAFTPSEIENTTEEMTQSKVKDSKEKESKELNSTHTADEIELFSQFQTWIDKWTPRVNKLKEPLTIDEYLQLRSKFSGKALTEVLKSMQNHKQLLTKYISANLTIQNWVKRIDLQAVVKTDVTDINQKIKNAVNGSTSTQ